jgi:hypothetical protein
MLEGVLGGVTLDIQVRMTKPFNCANQPGNFEKKASSRCFD